MAPWEFALVLLLLVFSVLVIYLIPTVINFNRAVKKVSKTIDLLNEDLPDIMYDISEITYSSSKASKQIGKTIDNLSEVEQTLSKELKKPLLETAASVGGLLQAIQTFVTYFIKKK